MALEGWVAGSGVRPVEVARVPGSGIAPVGGGGVKPGSGGGGV
jgi:hypothetical protein